MQEEKGGIQYVQDELRYHLLGNNEKRKAQNIVLTSALCMDALNGCFDCVQLILYIMQALRIIPLQVVVGGGGAGGGLRRRICYAGDGIGSCGATGGGNGGGVVDIGGGWRWWLLVVVGFVLRGDGGGFMNIWWWWVVDDVTISCWLVVAVVCEMVDDIGGGP
ncbi:hypothetical protein C5167_018380 [Papaver somniferum]|uniref:Uncharacterized protein n=1 Tax=Papaver somniferum TaxID=3469 RepID=A0A4Y7IR47_PAPSO|nr:hypothetical protein C5167_018380 [Papaver somniferum]